MTGDTNDAFTRVTLEPFFLHHEQVTALLGARRLAAHSQGWVGNWAAPHAMAAALGEALPQLAVRELQALVAEGDLQPGRVVCVEQEFDFHRAKDRDNAGDRPIDFQATLNTDARIVVEGTFNASRLVSDSAAGYVRGIKNVCVVGTVVAWDGQKVLLRPAFVGIRSYVGDET